MTQSMSKNLKSTIFDTDVLIKIMHFLIFLEKTLENCVRVIAIANTLLHGRTQGINVFDLSQFIALMLPNETLQKEIIPIVGNIKKRVHSYVNAVQKYMMLHLIFQHLSKKYIIIMCDKKCYEDMPSGKIFLHINCSCWICLLRNSTKIPRGITVDVTQYKIFESLHMDFQFFGVESLC